MDQMLRTSIVQSRATDVRAWIRCARGELSRQRGSRAEVLARDLADWGNYEVRISSPEGPCDQMGVADPDRLGIGGLSYGGILTDYVIATD